MKNNSNITDNYFVHICGSSNKWQELQMLTEVILCYQFAGESHIQCADGNFVVRQNQLFLAHPYQLARGTNHHTETENYHSIAIFLSAEMLQKFAFNRGLAHSRKYEGKYNLLFDANSLLTGFFQSLAPYLENKEQVGALLTQAKINELLELLLQFKPELSDFLFDFSKPYKVDLKTFMEKHYTHNVPLTFFAQLTGRSLATFKRDFGKTFNETPMQWLKNRRLEEAYRLMNETHQKATDLYLALGFENLSHFYTAFKQKYGITPKELLSSKK